MKSYPAHGFKSISRPDFREDVIYMSTNGVSADPDSIGDLMIPNSEAHQSSASASATAALSMSEAVQILFHWGLP
jgi:hypothetical protein